jgi:hypothetical protein
MLRSPINAIDCLSVRLALSLSVLLVAGATTASAQTFHGYPCTDDCSGHEAGYEWAERRAIDDPDSCGGNSNSFNEGCRAWAEENPPEPIESSEDEEVEEDEDGDGESDEE